jgi:hypothetical protein
MDDMSGEPVLWSTSACSEILNTARTHMAGTHGLRRSRTAASERQRCRLRACERTGAYSA